MDHNDDQPAQPGPEGGERIHQRWPQRVDRLELVAPSFWTRGMTRLMGLLLLAGFWFRQDIWAVLQAPMASWRMLTLVIAPPLMFLLYLLWRWWDMPREPRAIVFGEDHVELPASVNSKRTIELAYQDIYGVLMMAGSDDSRAVIIDTGSAAPSYADADFARPDGVGLLSDELFRRIRLLPNADQVLERMRQREKFARLASTKPIPVTKGLLALIAVYFAIELFTGALSGQQLGLIRLGANVPALIEHGQYWRLITANFLHGGWIHILFNGVALYILGMVVEKLLGSWRLLVIYIISALAGSVGSWLLGPGILSVGSSTAIFGLLGAFLVLHLRYWRQLPPPLFRQSIGWWVFIFVVNSGLPVVVPVIDYAAHITGLVGGALVTAALIAPMKDLKPDHLASRAVKILAGFLSALVIAGLGEGAIYALGDHPQDAERAFAGRLAEAAKSDMPATQVNQIAWMVGATNPDAQKWQIEQARTALLKAIGDQKPRTEFEDTLATLDYRLARMSTGKQRLGHIDEAITKERRVLDDAAADPQMSSHVDDFASQLARFLDYRHQIAGTLIRKQLFAEPPTARFDASASALEVRTPSPAPQQVAVWVPVRTGPKLYGLATVCVAKGQSQRTITGDSTLSKWPDDVQLAPALVEPASQCTQGLRFWPMSATVQQWP